MEEVSNEALTQSNEVDEISEKRYSTLHSLLSLIARNTLRIRILYIVIPQASARLIVSAQHVSVPHALNVLLLSMEFYECKKCANKRVNHCWSTVKPAFSGKEVQVPNASVKLITAITPEKYFKT
ncbi:hypothetical protein LOAG_00215 [Loa loa]|uniref:Uncharacterized protein n=1 Tax=Loa loa TaxID=7209 RepID=A0A1S0UBP2_LOALO|nr:hypothetical protein LOAG_00215 [Loa loa]EFO28258.1 hypothetical protein LOAG_00215 [Loa loa]